MVFSLLPVTAWAVKQRSEDEWKESTYGQKLVEDGYTFAGSYILKGTDIIYASFMIYNIDEQRTSFAYIFADGSGSGNKNIEFDGNAPWSQMNLDRVYIESGITGIGDNAFSNQVTMTDAVLPNTLTSIGDNAFANNRQMKITVESTEANVVDFSNITTIGDSAFLNCTSLGAGGNTTLKLGASLTSIGNSAFNSTSIRNVKFAELGDGVSLTIGNSAFAWCGIKSIELPEGLATIGDHAFAYNSLSGSLVIPDSVTDIGQYAFFVSSDSKNRGLTELTLGKNLGHVGESAFQNYIGLKTVNIRTTNTGLTLDSKAFGHDQTDAYWTDKVIDGNNYFVGADFKIVDNTISQEDQEKILAAFKNGVNCYLGAISPLQLVDTVDPTCLTDGTNEYQYTLTLGTGNTETKELFEVIPHLEHDWKPAEPSELAPSCEQPGRNLYVCMNAQGVIDPEDPEDVTVTDVATGAKVTVLASGGHYEVKPIEEKPAKEHNYQPSSAVNETINGDTGSGTTTLTYACTTPGHINADDPSFNSYGNVISADTRAKTVNFTVNWKAIQVTTVTTLNEIEQQLAGMVSNSAGTLSIVHENGQNGDTTLPAGKYQLKLLFTPSQAFLSNYTGMAAASQFGEKTLVLQGTVEKYELDFTRVYFKDAGATVSQTKPAPAATIHPDTPAPAEAGTPVFYYRPIVGDGTWSENLPDITTPASWYVKAEFRIDKDLYTVTNLSHVGSAAGYQLTYDEETGLVTITARYNVLPLNMDAIEVHVADGTYGDGADDRRINLLYVPGNSTVSYTIKKDGAEVDSGSKETTGTNPEESENMFIGTFKDAGTYQVEITVTNHSNLYDPAERKLHATVVVSKKTISVPAAIPLTYDPTNTRQQGVAGTADSPYTLAEDCFADNAGNYTGTVTLKDPDNTKWSSTDAASTTVSYTIAPVKVIVPTLTPGFAATYPYDGTSRTAAQMPTEADFTYSYVNGELIGYYKNSKAFAVTDAQRSDAGAYSTVAQLNNPADAVNYIWFNTNSSANQTLYESWAITRANYTLPSVTVDGGSSMEYTGQPLDESKILLNDQSKEDYSLPLVGSDKLTVGSYTWLKNGQPMAVAPSDVGEYQLKVTFQLSTGAKLSNYTFTGDDSSADDVITKTITVEITKATLTLQAGADITTPYTGGEIEIPAVTVSGLLTGGENAKLSYSYTPSGDGSQPQTQNTPFKFIDVGTYVVSVQPAADSNYTGEPVNVTLTITKAEQKVKLTAEEGTTLSGSGTAESPYTVTKELADEAFYVTGAGYVDNATTDGHATGATVSYSSGTKAVATVADNGTVTIKGAGETVITVTAAEDTNKGNYGPGTATYTLKVNKAMPTIDVSDYGGEFKTSYTGDPITGYEKAKLTGVSGIAPTGDLVYTFYTDADCANKVNNGGGTDSNIPIAVGEYYLKVSYAGDSNYNSAESTAIQVQVTKAAIGTVAVTPYYDTYDGHEHSLKEQAVTVEGFTSDQFTVQYAQSATQPDADAAVWQDDVTVKDVADSTGTMKYWYKVTIEGGNYEPAIGEIQVTITPKPLAVSGAPDSFEKVYDGDDTVTTVLTGIAVDTGVESETISVTATGAYDNENADDNKMVTLTLTLDGVSEWGNYSYKDVPLTEGKLTLTETTGKITPKPITVTGGITATPRVYDGTTSVELTGTDLTSSGVLGADKDDVQLTLKANAVGTLEKADAGENKPVTIATSQIQLDGDKAGNYDVTSVTPVTVNISKAPVTLTAPAGTTASYTGQPLDTKYYQVAASGLTGNDRVVFDAANDITYTFQKGSEAATTTVPSDQGTYTVTATLAATATDKYKNYDVQQVTFTVTISASALTVIDEDYSEPYDGKDHELTDLITSVTGVGNADVSGYDIVFVKSDTEPTDWTSAAVTSVKNVADSGTYWYRIGADNYTDETGSVEVTISRLALTVTPTLSPNTKVYDGTPDFPTANITSNDVTGEATGETIKATAYSAAYNSKDVADANTITIRYKLSGADLANYTYGGTELGNGTDTVSVEVPGTITAKPVTVTVPDQTMTYNGTATFTVGAGGIDCGAVAGTVTGESLTASIGAGKAGTADSKDVASATMVTFDAGAVTLTAGAATDARNYQVSGPVTAELTISPRTITLNFTNDQDGTITTPYTGNEVESGVYAATIDGVEPGDTSPTTANIGYTFYTDETCMTPFSGTPSGVGTYWVKAVVNEDPAINGNYTSAQATAKLVITTDAQVSLTVETNAYSDTYDGLPHNASGGMVVKAGGATLTDGDYTIYYTTAKPDDGNELNPSAYGSSTTMPSYTDAGSYTVYYLVDAKNYNDVAGSFTVEIERAMLTLTRDVTTTKTYDSTTEAASQVTNVELEGQKNSEKISAILASAVYNAATVADAANITVTYTLTAEDGAKLENYTVKIADAEAVDAAATMTETVSASITKAPVEVTIQNQSDVYDGAKPEVTQALWNTSDTVYSGDDLGITLSIPTNAKDVGTYGISGAASNPNYDVTFVEGQFEVTHRSVTIKIGDTQGVYGDAPDLNGVTLTDATASAQDAGMVSGENIYTVLTGLQLTTDASSTSPITDATHKYTISEENGVYGNYDVTFTKGTYTVNQRPVTVTIDDKSSLYGQDIVGLTWSVTGGTMANGEDLGITLETTAVKGSDAGTYAISEKSRNTAVAANYNVTVVGQTSFSGDSTKATYTIGRANLSAAFDSKVLYPNFGRPVTNPVTFSNASVNPYAEVVDQDDLAAIGAAAHYTSDNPSAVSVDEKTGAVTLISANASATISLTVGETQNFNAITVPVTYTINVGSAGGYQPNFTPGNLTYNGQRQQLMTLNGSLPAGLSIQYSTDNTSWKSDLTQITGTDAGNYTVYWKITDSSGNYGDSNGTVFVTIAKDILEDEEGFTHASPSIVFSQYQGTPYENPLRLPSDYHGTVTFQGSNDTVATIDADGKVTVKQNGTVTITATCYTDDNYQGRQYSYTLTVASSGIDYTEPVALEGTYNGGEQDSLTTPVTSTTPGAVIRYGVNTNGLSFPEENIPKIKDAGTYEIWYQVTAPGGYATVVGHVTAVIHPKNITEDMISGISDSYTYSGNKITPIPTVTDQELSQRLTANVDYTLSYGENTQVGTGTVTIAGTGNYGSSIQRTFNIEAVGGDEITASLSEYFGSLDQHPTGTSTQVRVTHGNHDVGFTITGVTPAAQVEADDKTISFTAPGVYTITVKAGDTLHAEQEFTLTYMLMPKTSDGGFAMTFAGNDTRVVTYGQRLIPEGQTAVDLLEVKDGNGTALTYGTDYTLSCMYYDCLGNSGQAVNTVQGIPAAGMYVVTAAGTGQYGSDQTGVFTLLVLQKNIGGEDITWTVADEALVYNAGAQEPAVTSGTFTDEAGGTQSVDFVVDSYQNNTNAGSDTARSIVKVPAGSNNYTGTASIPFSIGRRPITDDAGKFTITVPASVSISVGGEARPAVTIYDKELDRELTSQDFTVTYANNTSAGTATVSITGTGNYYTGTAIQKTFSVVVTSTTFSMEITPVTKWAYGDTGATDITVSGNSGITLAVGTDYTLSISKDGGAEQNFTNTADALAHLDKPGTYTVKATGIGGYSFTETQTVTIEKAKLSLEILVTPSVKAGGGTVTIRVTPGTWPAGIDGTALTRLTVAKDGTAQNDLTLKYDGTAGAYKDVTFSFGNDTAVYTFGVDTTEITGFDPDCYELAITGGTLSVVQQTSGGGGGGGGGGAVTYTITASAGDHGSINPAGKVSVVKGQDAAFVFTADSGWQVADVLVDGVSAGAVSSYTFINVTANHTISVTFEKDSTIADPDDTGVSDWLITGDHILYLNGYGQDLFGPTDNLTRAQAAQLFYNLLLEKDIPVTVSFTDVPADAWYAEAVHTLASLGIVEGVGGGLFDPERSITRAEFTVIAMRFAQPNVIDTDIFPDVSRNDWFYEQVVSAVQYGWINGYADGTFRPNETIIRAEVAAVVNRILGRSADRTYVDAHIDELTRFTDVSPYYWAYYDIMEAANAHDHAKKDGTEIWTD